MELWYLTDIWSDKYVHKGFIWEYWLKSEDTFKIKNYLVVWGAVCTKYNMAATEE